MVNGNIHKYLALILNVCWNIFTIESQIGRKGVVGVPVVE